MIGYKGMTKDMKCRGMQFEIGKTYHIAGDIGLCRNGLHFCKNLKDVFKFYDLDAGSRYFEIEAKEPIISDGEKCVTAELTVLREITDAIVNCCILVSGYGYGYDYGYGNGGYDYGYGGFAGLGGFGGYGYGNGGCDYGNGLNIQRFSVGEA